MAQLILFVCVFVCVSFELPGLKGRGIIMIACELEEEEYGEENIDWHYVFFLVWQSSCSWNPSASMGSCRKVFYLGGGGESFNNLTL